MCTGLEKYVTDENRLPPGSDEIYGHWIARQKQGINTMLKTRRERLMKITLFSEWYYKSQNKEETIKQTWNNICTGLEEYVQREKKLPPKSDKICGAWLKIQKKDINTLSEDKRERLLNIVEFREWFIESQKKGKNKPRKWDDICTGFEEYIQNEKKLPPQSDKIYGSWISVQKANIDSIPAKRRERLLKIKEFNEWYIEFNSKERTVPRSWNDMYTELVEFIQKEKRLPPSTNKKNNKDKRLARWTINQKEIIDTMPADRRERLMEIPIFKKWFDNRKKRTLPQ